jgi:hypothetical protein
MKTWLRRLTAPLIAVLAVAAVGVPALAGTYSGGSSFVDEVAHRLGISPAKLQKAIDDTRAARHEDGSRFGDRHFSGDRRHFHGEDRDHDHITALFAAAAGHLGISEDALRAELKSGKTLAQIAEANHRSAAGLEKALLDVVHAHLHEAVDSGRFTAAQAQRIEAGIAHRIGEFVRHGFGRRHNR